MSAESPAVETPLTDSMWSNIFSGQNSAATAISLIVHLLILGAMAAFKLQLIDDTPAVMVETIFSEEREQEEFTQELELDTTVSENLSVVAGGVQSTTVGASDAKPISQQKIEKSEKLEDPKVLQVGMVDIPGVDMLGTDLGEGEVAGEVGAHVDGYGAAMSRISQELLRLMRDKQVIVVWLFDASISLRDDREEISKQFNKIYGELNIAKAEAGRRKERYESLDTMIMSFGEKTYKLTQKPTADLEKIRAAIKEVKDDESGKENVFQAIGQVIEEYGKMANSSGRKLAVIVVSDESGDDADLLEDVIVRSKRFKAPVYTLGRESIFGYPYARMAIKDEATGIWVHPIVNRGPETAMPEALQYTGFGARHGHWADNDSAGFGPYDQVRLARESGGIFFLLAGVEADLGRREQDRMFDPIAMKEYEPQLMPRKEYVQRRSASKFRTALWSVIVKLNPNLDSSLSIRWEYPLDFNQFQEAGKPEFDKAVRAMTLLSGAIGVMDEIRPLRDLEAEQRWRAAYDLIYAQCLAYRVRLFQFILAIDQHVKTKPTPTDEKDNRWVYDRTRDLLVPDEEQIKATKIDMEQLNQQREKSKSAYQHVVRTHPGTPWAKVAERELNQGYGIVFRGWFRDPRWDDPKLRPKVPNL